MWWFAQIAVADETAAESTYDRFTSMQDLRAEPELVRPLEGVVVLEQGAERLRLEGGWLVPVFSGRVSGEWQRTLDQWARRHDPDDLPRRPTPDELGAQQLVGFVWTGGAGRLELTLPDRADAAFLANRMVKELHADAAALAPFAHRRAPFVTEVADACVIGLQPAVLDAFVGPEDHDPYEIIVLGTSDDARAAARHAQALFAAREALWTRHERPIGERVAWDRILVERGARDPADTWSFWDLLTADRYGLISPGPATEADRWLSVSRDPTGEVDERREIRVSSAGISTDGLAVDRLIGGIPHPPADPQDPTSAPRPRIRVEPVRAEAVVTVLPQGNVLAVKLDETLTVRATGATVPWIDLRLPQVDAEANTFRVLSATLEDGTPLLGRPPKERREAKPAPKPAPTPRPGPAPPTPPTPPTPPPADPREADVRLHLPVPLAPGQEVRVHIVFEDTWPYANRAALGGSVVDLGTTSGLQHFLPALRGRSLGAPWPMTAFVAVPDASKARVVVSGQTEREWIREDGWRIVKATSGADAAWFPAMSVGKFETASDPAQLGFPSIRAALLTQHFGAIEQFGPEARRIIQFYQGWLPAFPLQEIEVFEAPRSAFAMVWVAPHGLVAVQQMLAYGNLSSSNPRNGQPHLESQVYAHELAHQYFGHMVPPASMDDFWISESFSELFSCMYVGAAFDARDCEVRQRNNRARWERDDRPLPAAALSRAYIDGARGAVVYDYGPYFLGEILQRRLGRQAFFSAIDVLLREHPREPLTTERLQRYLELASGQDLDEAFAFWVYGGYVPALDLSWSLRDGSVVGTVRADVAFGQFDVPVRVTTPTGVIERRVTVTDGVGEVQIPVGARDAGSLKVELDPDGWVLASRRQVVQDR